MNADVLLITDDSTEISLSDNFVNHRLDYRFYDTPRSDYLTAWWINEFSLGVANSSRGLAGGFRQQALNRLLAQRLMQHRYRAVVLVGLHGCTLDLPRVFHLLSIPVIWVIPENTNLDSLDDTGTACLQDALRKCAGIIDPANVLANFSISSTQSFESIQSILLPLLVNTLSASFENYDYSLYEFSQRDHPLLCLFQEQDVRHFQGCRRVLDLGCGVGIFLGLLQAESINALGVERNPALVDYGRGMGLNIVQADALAFLRDTKERFDGIYCSHFVEHLPIELVQELLRGLARVLDDEGLLVLAFPDPESIRAQLLGFWRDPEHVRFYHPDLVASLALVEGLECEWSSYEDQPHDVGFFPLEPPSLTVLPEVRMPVAAHTPGLLARFWRAVGVAPMEQIKQLQTQIEQQQDHIRVQQKVISELAERSEQLWAVNRTWGWRDSVVLKLRRRSRCN